MDFHFCGFRPCLTTNGNARSFAVKTIVGATSPFFKFSRFAMEKDGFFSCLENKQSLEEELNSLKEKNIELENKAVLLESAKKENEELKIILSRPDKKVIFLVQSSLVLLNRPTIWLS